MLKIFASNLLTLRESKRFTQNYMAIQCGMSQPNYSDIERGKTNPSIGQLKKFAEVLGTTVDELLTEQLDPSHSKSDFTENMPRKAMTEQEKDIYIKILEERIRILLREKDLLSKPS